MSFAVPDNYYYPPASRYPPGPDVRRYDVRPEAYDTGAIDYGWPTRGQPQYPEFVPSRPVATELLPVTRPGYLVGSNNNAVYETGPPEFAYPVVPRTAVTESKPKFTTTEMSDEELREFAVKFNSSQSDYTSRTIVGEKPKANEIYVAPPPKREPAKWRISNVMKRSKVETKKDAKKDVKQTADVEEVEPVGQRYYLPEPGRRYIQPQEPYYPPEQFGGYYQPGPEVVYGRYPPTGYYI